MRFETFLIESKASGLEKIVNLLVQSLTNKTGTKYWRFGGHDRVERFKRSNGISGVGLTFCTDSGTMLRFNLENGEGVSDITSIDYWSTLTTPDKPTKTLKFLENDNIIQKVQYIISFLGSSKTVTESVEQVSGTQETSTLTKQIDAAGKHLNTITPTKENIFKELCNMVDLVISGVRPAIIVSGLAGSGKTTEIEKLCKAKLGPEGNKWQVINGTASAPGLYRALYINRDKLTVFDDCDDLFTDKKCKDILKAALDSKKEKEISSTIATLTNVSAMSPAARQDIYDDLDDALRANLPKPPKFPNMFPFTGRVIFITNLNINQLDKAVVSRSYHVPVNPTPEQMQDRLEEILPYICPESNMSYKKEVLEFISTHAREKLNARSFVQAMGIRESGNPDWKNYIIKFV